jgi:hypothetical protein
MEDFLKNVVQGFVGTLRQEVCLFFLSFAINFALFTLFDFNLWTFVLAHVAFIALWIITKPIK